MPSTSSSSSSGLVARTEDRVVVAERQHLDHSCEPLAACDGGRLPAARIQGSDAPMRANLVLGERRREALVDVLRRVHDGRKAARRGRKPLPRGNAERLLVHVEHIRGVLPHEAGERLRVHVRVTVDVTWPTRRKLDDRKVLARESRVLATLGPSCVTTRVTSILAATSARSRARCSGVAPAVIHAQDIQGETLLGMIR